MGDIILPKKSPNFTQMKLKGLNRFELIKPRIKKINDVSNAHILKDSPLNNGHNANNKKNIKKTNPKLLFELIFCIFFKLFNNIYLYI